MRIVEDSMEKYAKMLGIGYLNFFILEVLEEAPENCTQKLICERTHLPKQSVYLFVKSLWEQGYVELRELPTDRRNKEVILTESGQQYVEAILGKMKHAEQVAWSILTTKQQEIVVEATQAFAEAFQEALES